MTSANRRPVEGSLIPFAPRTLLHGTSSATSATVYQIKRITAVEGNQHARGFAPLHPPHFVCLCVIERKVMHDLIEQGPFLQPV